MTLPLKSILTFLICCALSACSTLRNGGAPDPSFDINTDLEQLAKQFNHATSITDYYNTPLEGRTDARNRFVSGRLVQIDLRYLQFIRALTTDKQQLDSATDIANLTLNLAGTLVGGARAKGNLAAAAASIGGARSVIDRDYYYEKSIDALVATMNAKRQEVLVPILSGLAAPLEQYPFERALTQLQEYYQAGTLNSAIQFIHTEAGKNQAVSAQKIAEIYVPSSTQISDTERLTIALGSLTQTQANQILTAFGVSSDALPKTLEGDNGAKQQIKSMIRTAMRSADTDARNAAIKKLSDAFRNAGALK